MIPAMPSEVRQWRAGMILVKVSCYGIKKEEIETLQGETFVDPSNPLPLDTPQAKSECAVFLSNASQTIAISFMRGIFLFFFNELL